MYGAIIGDIAGSTFELHNVKTKDFPLFAQRSTFTDATVMTVAVARALLKSREEKRPFKAQITAEMRFLGRRFPNAGYGGKFSRWLFTKWPKPYNSFGNGSAMRSSPCGLIAVTLEETLALAKASAEVTHNHPEGVKGAQAVAAAIFLARNGQSKDHIRAYIEENFYRLDKTLDEIRPDYGFDVSCQGSVPQAITAFLESVSFEDAIRNAVSLGGDSDTVAAMTGGLAWSYYRFNSRESGPCKNTQKPGVIWPDACEDFISAHAVDSFLPPDFVETIEQFDQARMHRFGTYDRSGFCSPIPIE